MLGCEDHSCNRQQVFTAVKLLPGLIVPNPKIGPGVIDEQTSVDISKYSRHIGYGSLQYPDGYNRYS
jgi:hypothetical protein